MRRVNPMAAAAARERELALLAQVQDAREHALQLQVEAAKREAALQVDAARRCLHQMSPRL